MRRFTQVCNAVLVITGLLAVPLSSYADPGNGKGHGNPHGQSKKQGHKGNGNSQKSGQRKTTAAGYCKESGSCLYA